MAKNNNLTDFLTNLANKFRSVLGISETINPQNFEGLIDTTYTKGYNDAPKGTDVSDTTAVATDVRSGKYFYLSDGTKAEGSLVPLDVSDTTATQSTVLTGKYFYNSSGNRVEGSMSNRGAVSGTITTKEGSVTISKGYHNGSGKVTISDTEQDKIIARQH